MQAVDGKMRLTDVADVEQLFRLIQSIPSPEAEPFKRWLAEIARERLEEIYDPELGIERLMEYYHRKGYSANWINQRLKSIEVRKGLKTEILRDNMTNMELILNMLAEASTTEISKDKNPLTFAENAKVAQEGGSVAAIARKQLESKTGKKVVSQLNAKSIKSLKKDDK